MPTAAKLAAAILFGALAWWVSVLVTPLFPEGTDLGRFAFWNALIGAFIGWRVAGGRARTTWPNAVAYGMTAAVEMVGVALLLYSTLRMLSQSTRMVYEGPIEALADVARIMVENLTKYIVQPDILITLVVGGVLAGLATEWVARNYR
jgi:hypothetical protein